MYLKQFDCMWVFIRVCVNAFSKFSEVCRHVFIRNNHSQPLAKLQSHDVYYTFILVLVF